MKFEINNFKFQIGQGAAFVGDGGIGTMLQSIGLPVGTAPERWTLERPEAVQGLYTRYAGAGARWLTTNTFGANRARLTAFGLQDEHDRINQDGVLLARGSLELPVLASIGPTGMSHSGEWERIYADQVRALADGSPAGYLVETIVQLDEGCTAVRAAAVAGPAWATFTPGADGRLLDGSEPERAAEALARAGASVVGVNCGAGPESLLSVSARLVRAGVAPVLAAPNAGLPVWQDGCPLYDLSPDGFARAAIQFQELGVPLFAGCCGTTPEHISAAIHAVGEDPSLRRS